MNIDGKPLDQCSDDEIRRAFLALVSVIGAQEMAEVQGLQLELLWRRDKAMANLQPGIWVSPKPVDLNR